jgi:probable rRNA maturation factor
MNVESSLCISGETDKINTDLLKDAQQVIYNTLGLSRQNVISVVFCNDSEIRSINKRYRGVDQVTDVISFPADEGTGFYSLSGNNEVFLGELLINTHYIEEHNSFNNLNLAIVHVFVHGVLHLLGYDHLNYKQTKKMQEIEKKILSLIAKDNS